MKFSPYPFQQVAVDHAVHFLRSAGPGDKQLYAAPTGSGKSVVELLVQQQLEGCWIVTPRDEIVSGMLEKLGFPGADPLKHRISTPIILRNRLMSGAVEHPKYLVFDEGHHHSAETWQQIHMLTGFAPAVAYTATPYRGTPRSTAEFIGFWGEPLWLITINEAAESGYIKLPRFDVLPLVDDDIVDISAGEFNVTSIDGVTLDRLGDMAEHARAWYSGLWDKPTVFALPSTACCVRLQQEMLKRGLPCFVVSAHTPKSEREPTFEAVKQRIAALLHINIVSEGVDLPLRRLVDLAPTLSPVKWVQQLGRITRPTDDTPVYVGTNRNLLRHAYTLEGAVPTCAVADAEKKFGPTERSAAVRALGLEALGRFKPALVKLRCGASMHVYAVSTVVGKVVVEYAVLVHPTMEPIWAVKANTVEEGGEKKWGKWCKLEDPPDDVRGFASVAGREPSVKQQMWWKRSAAAFGLEPDQKIDRKSFQALPVLADIGLRLQ